MPFSLAAQPEEDELECAQCGSYFYYELTRCPECGVNIYEPDEDSTGASKDSNGFLSKIRSFFQRISRKPYSAEEVFGNSLNQAQLYSNLLSKVGGDEYALERLVNLESELLPNSNRIVWLENAIARWERDNRVPRT